MICFQHNFSSNDAVVNVGGELPLMSSARYKSLRENLNSTNPRGGDHSWFVSFAPLEKPQIVIAVYCGKCGFGATVAAPIARDIMMKYFKISYPRSNTDSTKSPEVTTAQ